MDGPTETRREHEEHAGEVTLKEHLVALIEGLTRTNETQHAAIVAQLTATTVLLASLTESVRSLELTRATLDGKASTEALKGVHVLAVIAAIVGAGGLLVGLANILLRLAGY